MRAESLCEAAVKGLAIERQRWQRISRCPSRERLRMRSKKVSKRTCRARLRYVRIHCRILSHRHRARRADSSYDHNNIVFLRCRPEQDQHVKLDIANLMSDFGERVRWRPHLNLEATPEIEGDAVGDAKEHAIDTIPPRLGATSEGPPLDPPPNDRCDQLSAERSNIRQNDQLSVITIHS